MPKKKKKKERKFDSSVKEILPGHIPQFHFQVDGLV